MEIYADIILMCYVAIYLKPPRLVSIMTLFLTKGGVFYLIIASVLHLTKQYIH